ncbi:MAG TPA: phosphate ABC transporter permease PstA [Ktedonobacteraceae bacterium]|jgi:phosphate transport system permease protein|nr:phosphate ABC transporter permease PstA [Ktedonobacteraceae bacterium]
MSVPSQAVQSSERVKALTRLTRQLHARSRVASTVLWIIAAIVTIVFVAIIIDLLVQGVPYMINPDFYAAQGGSGTIGQQFFNTIYILVLSEIILIPISLAAAIYLTEYARQGPLVSAIHFAAETLAGVPSIVLGLFGAIVFVTTFHLELSRLSGALTLLCLNFPMALRLFEDALTSVPREMREGGLALGSTKWHVIRTVVLPSALSGIVTSIILSAGKIIAEAAALIYTMGTANPANVLTLNPLISGDTLTIHIWAYETVSAGDVPTNVATAVSAGSAALLIIILLVINIVARTVGRIVQRAVTAA